MSNAPRLSLRGIRSFRGHEGLGLNATLLLDCVPVAEVLDEGNGGALRFYWKDACEPEPKFEDAVLGYLRELGINGWDGLDMLLAEMADDAENAKRMKRMARRHVLFRLSEDGEDSFRRMPHRGRPEEARAAILKKWPNARFLQP